MDLNFDLNSLEFSLEMMCSVKITSEILSVSRAAPGFTKIDRLIEDDAKKRIDLLCLPQNVQNGLKNLIRTVNGEFNLWPHNMRRHGLARLIWTPQGTVDTVRCVELILEDKRVAIFVRFVLACVYCLEKHIFRIWKKLNVAKKRLIKHYCQFRDPNVPFKWWVFANIWIEALHAPFVRQNDGVYSLQDVYDNCFKLALIWCTDAEVRCYSGKASPEAIWAALQRIRFCIRFLSPSTLCCIFSRLSEENQRDQRVHFERALMEALLQWPYVPHFLRAVDSTIARLDAWFLISKICLKIYSGCKAYDYRQLIKGVWKIIAMGWPNSSDRAQLQLKDAHEELLSRREYMVNVFMRGVVIDGVRSFLLNRQTWITSVVLIQDSWFGLFEQLLLSQAAQGIYRKHDWEKFQHLFLAYMSSSWRKNCVCNGQLQVAQHRVDEIINRIIAKCRAD